MRNTASIHTSRGAIAVHNPRGYASPEDFCAIFRREMDTLYPLALVLTGNHTTAQQCFLAALDDCRYSSTVFPEYVRSWSKRAIIKNAVRLIQPTLRTGVTTQNQVPEDVADDMDVSGRSILRLRAFDRFVFVMAVLERYTIPECAALLSCGFREVEEARVRALQHLAPSGQDLAPVVYENGFRSQHIPALALE